MNNSWLSDPKHPIWLILRQVVVIIPLTLLLGFGYSNGWAASDIKTILGVVISLGMFDAFKSQVTK